LAGKRLRCALSLSGYGWHVSGFYVCFDSPELDDIGPMAAFEDLAFPLAHALRMRDRQGAPRPRYTLCVDDSHGNKVHVTELQEKEFRPELERALEGV
jgi:hypothetical protein